MKTQHILLVLTALGGAYAGLALRAGPSDRSSTRTLLSDPVPEARAETSGTRLKAVVTTGADGSKLFASELLHDSTLDIDCTFHKASDGMPRCLPIVGGPDLNVYASLSFKDDKCSDGVIWVNPAPSGCTTIVPKYVYRYGSAPYCGAADADLEIHVYQTGALVGNPSAAFVINSKGDCVQGGYHAQEAVAYAVTAELSASTFVAGTLGVDP
jgi:hypothetical protein